MPKVEELVGQLRQEATLEAAGGFTLDPEKAREKMRQFQLPDPRLYVLHLVEVAVLKGATRIDFAIDSDDMTMSFDGEPITREDLEHLYTSLFVDRTTMGLHARRELAIGVNAAMALNPRYLRLRSGDGHNGVSFEARGGDSDDIEDLDDPPSGTRIHVKDRFRPGLVVRFVRNMQGQIPEIRFLQTGCRWTPVPVSIDGKAIGPEIPFPEAVKTFEVKDREFAAVGGFRSGGKPNIVLLSNGVWVTSHELEHFAPGFVVMAEARRLRKNVSQTDFIRDETYWRLLELVRRLHDEAVGDLAARCLAEAGWAREAWVRRVLLTALGTSERGIRLDKLSPGLRKAADVPLWPTVTGDEISSSELLGDKKVGYSRRAVGGLDKSWRTIVFAPDQLREDLRRVFGDQLDDKTRHLEREQERLRNRARWLSRPHPPRLPAQPYLAMTSIRGPGFRGEVGLRATGSGLASVRLIKRGHLLYEVRPRLRFPGLVAVVEGNFKVLANYNGAHRDERLADVLIAILRTLPILFAEVAGQHRVGMVRTRERNLFYPYVAAALDAEFPVHFLREFGFAQRSAIRHLGRHEPHPHRPNWGLGTNAPHPLSRIPLFETIDAHVVSLWDLAEMRGTKGQILYAAEHHPYFNSIPERILRAPDETLALLTKVFDKDALVDANDVVDGLVAQQEFMARPTTGLVMPVPNPTHSCRATHRDGSRDIPLWVGLDLSRNAQSAAQVAVYIQARHLATIRMPAPISGLVVAIGDDEVTPNENYTGIAAESHSGLAVAVHAGLGALLAKLAEQAAEEHTPPRRSLRSVLRYALALAFRSGVWFRVYRHLTKTHDLDAALRTYYQIIRLADGRALDDVGDALEYLLGQGKDPDVEAVSGVLERRPQRSAGADVDVAIEAMRRPIHVAVPFLEAIPLFDMLGGGDAPLGELVDLDGADGRVRYVTSADRGGPDVGDQRIVVANGEDLTVLQQIFGGHRLEDAKPWLVQRARERLLADRSPRQELSIDEGRGIGATKVEDGSVRGELALLCDPWNTGGSEIDLTHERRPLCTLRTDLPLPFLGIIDDPAFAFVPETLGVSVEDEGRVRALCEAYTDRVLANVIAQWPRLPAKRRAQAAAPLRRYLCENVERYAVAKDDIGLGLAGLEIIPREGRRFVSLGGIVGHQAKHGVVDFLPTDHGGAPADDLVVIADDRTLDMLNSVLGRLRDYREVLRARAARDRARAASQPMPSPPSDLLARVNLDEAGLKGSVWLNPRTLPRPAIGFGDQEFVAEFVALSMLFPCYGAVWGPGVEIAEDWGRVSLGPDQRAELVRSARALYESLADRYAKIVDARGDGWAPWHHSSAARNQLMHLMMRLRHALARPDATPPDARVLEDLLKRISTLPLLQVSSGHLISLQTAVRERPIELAHLDLWPKEIVIDEDDLEVDEDDDEEEDDAKVVFVELDDDLEDFIDDLDPDSEAPLAPTADSAQVVLTAVRAELTMVRGENAQLLADAHLDRITWGEVGGDGLVTVDEGEVRINPDHPIAQAAVGSDPVAVSFVASACYSALNRWLESITDHDEWAFHRHHAAFVLSGLRDPPTS